MSQETPDPKHDDDTETGAEGGESEAKDNLPGAPAEDDDSPLGDTDQHSSANA